MPKAPSPGNDCCVIGAPAVTNHFTVDSRVSPDSSNLQTCSMHSEGFKLHSVDPADTAFSWHSPQTLYDCPEKLSVFRI